MDDDGLADTMLGDVPAQVLEGGPLHQREQVGHGMRVQCARDLPGDGGLFERLDGRRQDAGREALLALDTLRLWLQRVSYGRSPLIIGPFSQLTKPHRRRKAL